MHRLSAADSTSLAVCDNLRISRHRVFQGCAARGKTSTGWFFGFKLHVVINHVGELLNLKLTPGNVEGRKPLLQTSRASLSLWSKLYKWPVAIGLTRTEVMYGVTGFEVQSRCMLEKPPLRTIIITAHDEQNTRQRCLSAGATAYFCKPVDNEELLEAIKKALG